MPSDILAIPDLRRPSQRSELAAGSSGAGCGLETRFECPVCGTLLSVPRDSRVSVTTCTLCHSGVVAPQPQFGCRAMPYRDWLRLQEIDTLDVPAPPPPAQPKLAPRPARPRLRRPRRLASKIAALVALTSAAGWLWLARFAPASSSATPRPAAASALPDRLGAAPPRSAPNRPSAEPKRTNREALVASPTLAPVIPKAPATDEGSPPPETGAAGGEAAAAPAVRSPLATALAEPTEESTPWMVVMAARRHDFSRSAPRDDQALCLKLTDPADESVTTRAYVNLADPMAGPIQELLPWGQDSRVRIRIAWHPPDASANTTGHWRITAFEWAPGTQEVAATRAP